MSGHSWLDQSPIEAVPEDLLEFAPAAGRLAVRLREIHRSVDAHGLRALTASLEGRAGSGKTSFSNLVVAALAPPGDGQAPLPVALNVGRSGSPELSTWASIAYRFGEGFYRRFHRLCLDQGAGEVEVGSPVLPGDTLKVSTETFLEPRLHWLEVAWRLSKAVPDDHWAPCLKLFNDAPTKVPGRRLGWRSGKEALLAASQGLVAAVGGQAGPAVEKGGQAAGRLLETRLVEGPTWGVDTVEFIRDLGRLLAVLHPRPRHWRSVLVLDDVARLQDGEAEQLAEALAHLRELEDVLVLVCLDAAGVQALRRGVRRRAPGAGARRGGPEPSAEPAGPRGPGETEPTGIGGWIDLRVPIPVPTPPELFGLARRFVEELELPLTETEISGLVRHLRNRDVLGPREVKRALLWLWLRLVDPSHSLLQESRDVPLSRELRRGVLAILTDLHLFVENRLSSADLVETAEKHFRSLAHFPVRPWNLKDWIDRQGRHLLAWKGRLDADARDLILILRLLALGEFAGAKRSFSGHRTRAQELWRRWRNAVVEDDVFKLSGMDDASPRALVTHLDARIETVSIVRSLATGHLVSAVRHFELAEAPTVGSSGPRLRESWFDLDLLVTRLQDESAGTDERRRSWVLVNFFHPRFVEGLGPLLAADWSKEDESLLRYLEERRSGLVDLLRENG